MGEGVGALVTHPGPSVPCAPNPPPSLTPHHARPSILAPTLTGSSRASNAGARHRPSGSSPTPAATPANALKNTRYSREPADAPAAPAVTVSPMAHV